MYQYGVDSLVALEVRNWITREMKANIVLLDILDAVPMETFATQIAQKSKLIGNLAPSWCTHIVILTINKYERELKRSFSFDPIYHMALTNEAVLFGTPTTSQCEASMAEVFACQCDSYRNSSVITSLTLDDCVRDREAGD